MSRSGLPKEEKEYLKALIENGERQEIKRDAQRYREHIKKVQEEMGRK